MNYIKTYLYPGKDPLKHTPDNPKPKYHAAL